MPAAGGCIPTTGEKSGDTIIRYGKTVLWREPCVYEGYERYIEVIGILKEWYGSRLYYLIPTDRASGYLYGYRLSSIGTVAELRAELRAASTYLTDEELEA